MAKIKQIKPLETLRQTFEPINKNFNDLNEDISLHKSSTQAHDAIAIKYGNSNVKQELDAQDRRIDNLIITSGDSSPEVSDARGGFPVLGARLDALTEYLNFMPINGGDFDGNDPTGPIIDGGTY